MKKSLLVAILLLPLAFAKASSGSQIVPLPDCYPCEPDTRSTAVDSTRIGPIDCMGTLPLQDPVGFADRRSWITRHPPVEQHIEFGDEDLAEPKVASRIDHALLRQIERAA